MINLPSMSESTLAVSLEGPWGSDVVLIGPDGVKQFVRGQVTRKGKLVGQDSRGIAKGGRNSMVSYRAIVVLRRSQVDPVPTSEENWAVVIPPAPGEEPTVVMYLEQEPDGDQTYEMLTLRLTKTKQVAP